MLFSATVMHLSAFSHRWGGGGGVLPKGLGQLGKCLNVEILSKSPDVAEVSCLSDQLSLDPR